MALGEWCSMAGEREGREEDEASAARERGWCVCSPAVGGHSKRAPCLGLASPSRPLSTYLIVTWLAT